VGSLASILSSDCNFRFFRDVVLGGYPLHNAGGRVDSLASILSFGWYLLSLVCHYLTYG
jgi:hypothetical protein